MHSRHRATARRTVDWLVRTKELMVLPTGRASSDSLRPAGRGRRTSGVSTDPRSLSGSTRPDNRRLEAGEVLEQAGAALGTQRLHFHRPATDGATGARREELAKMVEALVLSKLPIRSSESDRSLSSAGSLGVSGAPGRGEWSGRLHYLVRRRAHYAEHDHTRRNIEAANPTTTNQEKGGEKPEGTSAPRLLMCLLSRGALEGCSRGARRIFRGPRYHVFSVLEGCLSREVLSREVPYAHFVS